MISPGKVITHLAIWMALLASFMMACSSSNKSDSAEYQKVEGMVWNTTFHVTYQGNPALADSIAKVLNEVGDALNVFDEQSLVSQVNRQDSTPINEDFIRVYSTSVKISRATDGAFDPTLAPLIKAWGFGQGHTPTNDTVRVDSILEFCGIDKTHIAQDIMIKDDIRTQFNFSAIAKGYACDRVGEMLESYNVENYLVEIGGEINARGVAPSGEDWKVSIDKPTWQSDTIMHDSQIVIAFTDMGMATSGNYRNFHTDSVGNRFGHTISAQTGRPVETDVISATVLSSSAMEADALATAFMAMGSKAAISLNDHLDLPVFLILSDSTLYISPKFKDLVSK